MQYKKLALLFVAATFFFSKAFAGVIEKTPLTRILCVGDSITEGKNVQTGGYRKPLQEMLRATGYATVFVGKEDDGTAANKTGYAGNMENANHEGYGSFRVDEILNGGSEEGRHAPPFTQTLATYHPDAILMMLGTNDVIQNHDVPTLDRRIETLVDAVFTADPKVTLVLAQITPLPGSRETTVSTYNAQIAALVQKEQTENRNIVLADMHSALSAPDDLEGGVHPTQQGFNKMAATWYEALTGKKAPAISSAIAAAPAAPAAPAGAATGENAFTFTDARPEQNTNSYVIGFRFTTGTAPIKVTALGYLNDGATGPEAKHAVGIYDGASKQLVTPALSVTTAGGSLSGQNATFTYVKLEKPILLPAKTTFVLAGTESGHGYLEAPTGVAYQGIDPASVHTAWIGSQSGLVYPDQEYTPNDPANVGPNFQIQPLR